MNGMVFGVRCWVLGGLVLLASSSFAAPAPGEQFPTFSLREGEATFDWKPGRTTVVTFCAYWCDTWKDQFKRLSSSFKAMKGLPVDAVAISVDGRWTELSKDGEWGRMLSDPGGAWSQSVGIDRVPYTFVVNPRGEVQWCSYGIVRSPDLIRAVNDSISGVKPTGLVYLTFDDFPSERLSHELLDLLRKEEVPATFFAVGSRLVSHVGLFRRAVAEGHSIQSHSWSHDATDPRNEEFARVCRELSLPEPTLYRPPGSNEVLRLADSTPLAQPFVDPYDFKRPPKAELLRRINLRVKPNAVIQLHVGVEETLQALPDLIAALRNRGYSFGLLR